MGKEEKKLFSDHIGNYRVIYNKDLKTCIVGNIYTSRVTGAYSIFVIDLITDEILFSYLVYKGEFEDKEGMTNGEAIKRYEEFGLRAS